MARRSSSISAELALRARARGSFQGPLRLRCTEKIDCIRSARVFTVVLYISLEMADAQSFRAWWDTVARQGQTGATRRVKGDDETTRELRWQIFCNNKQLREELFQAINVGVDY